MSNKTYGIVLEGIVGLPFGKRNVDDCIRHTRNGKRLLHFTLKTFEKEKAYPIDCKTTNETIINQIQVNDGFVVLDGSLGKTKWTNNQGMDVYSTDVWVWDGKRIPVREPQRKQVQRMEDTQLRQTFQAFKEEKDPFDDEWETIEKQLDEIKAENSQNSLKDEVKGNSLPDNDKAIEIDELDFLDNE